MMSRSLAQFLVVILVALLRATSAVNLMADAMAVEYKVTRIEQCVEHPVLPHTYTKLHMEMDPDTDDLYVSGILNASEPLQQGTKATLKVLRCLDEEYKSCDKYIELDVDDFCKHLPEKNARWSTVVGSLQHFDPHCPVAPGVYELHEAPLSTKSMSAKQAMMGRWQLEVVVTYEGRMMACLRGDAEITPKRRG